MMRKTITRQQAIERHNDNKEVGRIYSDGASGMCEEIEDIMDTKFSDYEFFYEIDVVDIQKIVIEINTTGDLFMDNQKAAVEVARILYMLADNIANGDDDVEHLKDLNGNTVGNVTIWRE